MRSGTTNGRDRYGTGPTWKATPAISLFNVMGHEMKQAQRKQMPVVSVDNAPAKWIILPPVQVRRTTPAVTRAGWREADQRLLPPLLGLGVLLPAWQLAAMHSKSKLPTPLEHAGTRR